MRTILHCDLNNFYASVECLRHPEYRDVPIAVTGDPSKRHGIILAKNNLAKAFGVRTGDVIWQARLKCPELVCLPPHYEDYVRFSEQVFEIYTHYTDCVEAFGPDECWLDVTGSQQMFGDGKNIADTIRAHVTRASGLTVSAGVSWNKIYAKLGSDFKKPDATTVIDRNNYQQLVYPLPVGDLFMVGKATVERLAKLNIRTIGELANSDDALLAQKLGVNGIKLGRYARGEDTESVRKYYQQRVPKSIGHGITASRDLTTEDDLRVVTYFLADKIAKRLRKNHYAATRVSVDLRSCLLTHRSHQGYLPYATDSASVLAEQAFALIQTLWKADSTPVRTITIGSYGLEDHGTSYQTSLFLPSDLEREHRLGVTLDALENRFGSGTVKRALTLGKDFVYDKTDSEDFLPFKR